MTIATNQAVTGNHDGKRIPAIGMAYRPCCLRHSQALRQLPIGQGCAKRNALEFLPDALLKRRAWWGERQCKKLTLALKVFLELVCRTVQQPVVLLPRGRWLYGSIAPLEVHAYEALFGTHQTYWSERRSHHGIGDA
jgi:hypothetical protein